MTLDKQAHFWAGMAIFGLLVAIVPAWAALLGVSAAAAGKELLDRRTHPADWLDAVATIAGGLVSAAWGFGVQLV